MKTIAVLTSGGDAPGMNAVVRAIVHSAIHNQYKVLGVEDGYKGLVEGRFIPLDRKSVARIINRGGTFLGSVRYDNFKSEDVQKEAVNTLRSHNIDALIVVGGEGTYRGAAALSKFGVKVIGIPATIDNDIVSTDYSIGFFSALDTAVESIDKLRDTSDSHQRCSVVEIMGRDCGDLALYAGLAGGSEIVITPETGYDEDEVVQSVEKAFRENKRHAIVVVTERLTDVSALAKKIEEKTGFESRATVLGHVQRGGTPQAFDRVLAAEMGHFAVGLIKEDQTGSVLGLRGNRIVHYSIPEALTFERASRKSHYEIVKKLKH